VSGALEDVPSYSYVHAANATTRLLACVRDNLCNADMQDDGSSKNWALLCDQHVLLKEM